MFFALGLGLLLSPNAWPGTSGTSEGPEILLGVGEQRLLHIEGLNRYSISGTSIRARSLARALGADQGSDSLLVKAVEPGYGDLWVWKQDGSSERRSIRVEKLDSDHPVVPSKLERALSRLQEVEVYWTGAGATLRGQILSAPECARIQALQTGYPKEVLNETELSDGLASQAASRLESWKERSKWRDALRIERTGNAVWVRGAIRDPSERAEAERQARSEFACVRTELESLPDTAPTVYFRVFLLELKKSRMTSFGIGWPPSQLNAFHVTASKITQSVALDLAIQALEDEGSAKVLSNPELVVRAPGDAELFAGGELPVRATSQYSSSVTWKPFGLTLKLHVTATDGDRVRLDILTEVSRLDTPSGAETLPNIQANRMKTQVDARFGSPLLLSGLLQDNFRKDARGLPLLRRLPILGALFGSEDFLNERSELVAILLPLAEPPKAPELPAMRHDFADGDLPRGPVPAPRNWISPARMRQIRMAPTYPWNAFKTGAR